MSPTTTTLTLDRVEAIMTRLELIQDDLQKIDPEARRLWKDIARLFLNWKASKHAGEEVAAELSLNDREISEAVERLATAWADRWKAFDPEVDQALRQLVRETGRTRAAVKRDALRTAIILALRDADEEQITRLGHDRAYGHGSRLVLVQRQELKNLNEEVMRKLTSRPAGLRTFPSEGLLSPIEAVFLGHVTDPERVRPLDLRPELLLWWVRVRATTLAEERLVDEAGLARSDAPESVRQVEVRRPESEPEAGAAVSEQLAPLELLKAVDLANPDPLDPLIVAEERAALARIATPRQREYLLALSEKWALGMSPSEAVKAVADEKDVKPDTIHKNRQRLRDRAAEQLPKD